MLPVRTSTCSPLAPSNLVHRCGSNKHSLSRCKKPEDPGNRFPFASCFVCSGKGHLAGSCPQNKEKGVYPNGGCCKLCGETTHLAKDCALRKNGQSTFFCSPLRAKEYLTYISRNGHVNVVCGHRC